MKHLYFLGLLIFLPFCSFSQGEWDNWYFGWHAAVTFKTGSPIAVAGSQLVQSAGGTSTTVSDSLGNLLYYSNGWEVRNKNNLIMPNGNGIIGGNACQQPVFSVPRIGNPNQYYLFTVGDAGNGSDPLLGLHYSVIDMTLQGGLGDIVSGMKNIAIPGGDSAIDQLTGIRHHNNRDVWIVMRKHAPVTYYISYRITPMGITAPVISPTTLPTRYEWMLGHLLTERGGDMKISQDGRFLVCTDSLTELCNFNDTTGVVTPKFKFYVAPMTSGAEFSLDSKYLYLCTTGASGPQDDNRAWQFDLAYQDSLSFLQHKVLIGDGSGSKLQMGPDWKIYCGADPQIDSLHCINNPSLSGLACNYQKNAVYIGPNQNNQCLIQFLQKYKAYIHHGSLCQWNPVHFNSDIWPPADTILWNFGDPGSGADNFSDIPDPTHLYVATGTYTVMLYVRHTDNRTDTTWKTITILPAPHAFLGPDETICSGDSLMLDAGACAGCTYVWDNLTLGLMNISNNQIYYAKTNGNYRVTIMAINGCSGSDSIIVSLTPKPQVTNNPLSKSICSGDSTKIALTSDVNGSTFNWTATLTSGTVTGFSADSGHLINQVLINTGAGPGIVTYHIIPKLGSCVGNPVDYAVTVTPGIPVSVSITATSLAVCSGIQVTFSAFPTNQGSSPVYLWKVNSFTAGTNSDTYTYAPANGDVIYCVLTSSNTLCTSNNPATSNSITMTVNPNLPVTVTVSASQNPSCVGTPVHFTATPTNGGLTPHYQWKVNGGNAGFDSTVYTYPPINGDIITCILTSSELCTTNNPASSIQYPASVSNNLPVSVTVSASQNPSCAGTTVHFTAAPTHGGTTPHYSWKVNGGSVGFDSTVYSYVPVNGDMVSVILTSSEPCSTNNPASSIQYPASVSTNLPVGVSITASQNPFCPGTAVTFSATPTNGGGNPIYIWKVNGTTVGGNSSSYTFNPVTGDSVRCIMNSNLSCVTGNPASSAKIILSGTLAPIVSFTPCFDTVTTLNAKPIKLKGGIPLGGTYSGPGVNSITGVFTPSLAGLGTKTISYSYTNVSLCTSISHLSIVVSQSSFVNCGNPLTDVRDNKVYETVQIGTQCWFAEDLNYGTEIPFSQYQRDNCTVEKYHNPASSIQHPASSYQWDELMQYDDTPADQGLCPPAWHVPTENDWLILFSNYTNNAMAGSPLKYSGYSGFNALLQGANHLNRQWDYPGFATFYWSSTSHGPVKAWAHGMNDIDPSVSFYPSVRTNAFSVRCIKD